MEWIKKDSSLKVPIKSWCRDPEDEAMNQAANLANHPAVIGHVALMPDCHVGYGMPIGGVIACDNAVIPNAVGVDIGCGMGAVRTNLPSEELTDKKLIREICNLIKAGTPVGEAHSHKREQEWEGFQKFRNNIDETPGWLDNRAWELALKSLGTLGGGNHFIEIQRGDDGFIWLMLHSGSRNLGYRIASFYHKTAVQYDEKRNMELPSKELAYFFADSNEGLKYIRDMNFALKYALENRSRMMERFKEAVSFVISGIKFVDEINIHHNYACLETHFGREVWVHRKGATSAKEGEYGIIPGSMGAASYIVKGLGNQESFMSCSHGAGRMMGRSEACRRLSVEECNNAMEGIVFDRWGSYRGRRGKNKGRGLPDLSEAPPAYKNIEDVIKSQLDLIQPQVCLHPIGVVKG